MIRRWWSWVAFAVVLSGCSDDPFAVRWEADPQESIVYALDAEELGVATAFDMAGRRPVVIEDASLEGNWDFAVDRESGQMVFLPASVLGVTSRAAIVEYPGVGFDEVGEAPADTTLYVSDEPVAVQLGTIYVIRTHEQRERGGFGRQCVFYGKLEPLEIDLELGRVRFVQDVSPDCNNRSLVPTSD